MHALEQMKLNASLGVIKSEGVRGAKISYLFKIE
jgi:hypothetical protein